MRRELIYLLLGGLVLGVVPVGATCAELVGWWMFDEYSGTVAVDSSVRAPMFQLRKNFLNDLANCLF